MLLNIFSIIVGLLQGLIMFLFPSNVTIETDGATTELLKLVILFGISTLFYSVLNYYVNYKIKTYLNSKSEVTILSNVLYYIASIISAILIMTIASIELAMGIMIIAAAIITNAVVLVYRYKKVDEDFGIENFWSNLYYENAKTNTNRKKIIAQETRLSILGLILGIISTLPLLIFYKGNEDSLFITIIAVALTLFFEPILVELVQEYIIDKKHKNNKNSTKNHHFLNNVLVFSYIFFSALSYFVVLTVYFKTYYAYSMAIAFIGYLITSKRTVPSVEICNNGMDFDPAESMARAREYERQIDARKSEPAFTSTTFFDSKGNYDGRATTYNIGGIEHTEVKDSNGKITGTGTSFELGGVKFNTYKKQ